MNQEQKKETLCFVLFPNRENMRNTEFFSKLDKLFRKYRDTGFEVIHVTNHTDVEDKPFWITQFEWASIDPFFWFGPKPSYNSFRINYPQNFLIHNGLIISRNIKIDRLAVRLSHFFKTDTPKTYPCNKKNQQIPGYKNK